MKQYQPNVEEIKDEYLDAVLRVVFRLREEEQIRAIMSKERSDRAGIGIKNVNDRLKIYFGAAYGITIDSEPDEGTRVIIRMPKVREEEEHEKE